MRKYFAATAIVALIALCGSPLLAQAPPSRKVALSSGRSLEDGFKLLCSAFGKKCLIEPDVRGTCELENIPKNASFDEAFRILLKSSPVPLTYDIKNGVYLIHTKPASASPPLAVSIVLPDSRDDGSQAIVLKDRNSHFDVVIQNISAQPVGLWPYDSMLGYDNVGIEIAAVDGKLLDVPLALHRGFAAFNGPLMPAPIILPPHGVIVREIHIYLNEQGPLVQAGGSGVIPGGDVYTYFPLPKTGSSETVTMRATFNSDASFGHLPPTQKVWSGKISSEAKNYTVYFEPDEQSRTQDKAKLP